MSSAKSLQSDSPVSDPDSDSIRQRIVTQARKHFLAHGFRRVTMDDLARELAMSKKTIYSHFSGKRKLVEAVISDKMRSADEDLARITTSTAVDFQGELRELLACMRRQVEELKPPFLRDLARETPDLFGMVQTLRRDLLQRHFGKLLRDGRKAGMIRKDLEPGLMIEILIGTTDALINPEKLSQLGITAKTCLSAILTIFLEGVIREQSSPP